MCEPRPHLGSPHPDTVGGTPGTRTGRPRPTQGARATARLLGGAGRLSGCPPVRLSTSLAPRGRIGETDRFFWVHSRSCPLRPRNRRRWHSARAVAILAIRVQGAQVAHLPRRVCADFLPSDDVRHQCRHSDPKWLSSHYVPRLPRHTGHDSGFCLGGRPLPPNFGVGRWTALHGDPNEALLVWLRHSHRAAVASPPAPISSPVRGHG